MQHHIRTITPDDNPRLAKIVRDTLMEFHCDKPGTAFADKETDYMYEQFSNDRSIYYVVETDGNVVGGAGINASKGYDDICELQKMYFVPEMRGKGLANVLMEMCIAFAKEKGYKKIYLESMDNLHAAISLYKKYGFNILDKPLSETGHFNCNVWMMKEVGESESEGRK